MKKLSLLFLLLLGTAIASEFPNNMLVFGDSISDVGNTQNIGPIGAVTEALSPITNGSTWPTYVYSQIGLSGHLTPSGEGGLEFAQSGALTNLFNPTLGVGSILSQVERTPSNVSRSSLVFIEGGYNDVNFTSRTGEEGAAAFIEVIQAARNKKFKHIAVLNLFDIGRAPTNSGMATTIATYVREFNKALSRQVSEQKTPVLLIDFFGLANDILDSPAKYNFFNTTDATPLNLPPAGFFFFYDGVHPNQAIYRILSDYISTMVLAPLCFGALAEVPFSLNREHQASIQQQIFPLQPKHELKKVYPFISGNCAPLMQHKTYGKTKQKTSGGEIIGGLTSRISENWTVGIAGAYTHDHNDCQSDLTYTVSSATGSLFGAFHPSRGYIHAIADLSWLDFSNMERNFSLGPVKSHTHASTDGFLCSATLNSAYFLIKFAENLYSGPTLSLNYQHVRVEGFSESGADFGAIGLSYQTNQMFTTGLGWEVDFNMKPLHTRYGINAALSVNRQWLKNSREIQFWDRRLPEGKAVWPYQNMRLTYASGLLNSYVEFSNHLTLSLGYVFNLGSYELSEHILTAGLSLPLYP